MSLLSGTQPRRSRGGSRSSLELPPAKSGPWKSILSLNGSALTYADGSLLYGATNMYCLAPNAGGAWISRPNIKRVGTLQLGSGTTRNGQCVFNHTRPDGTEDRLLFAGGKMYRWNGFPTLTDATAATATDITPGTVTISTTARIYCVSFAGLLIVTDGVNRPWKYDPATTTATYLQVDSASTAWTAYGPPWVYGGKLMFVKGTKGGTTYQNTFVWSEEADPSTGYEQTGFTNFWTLFQTSADRLICVVPTNAGMYYFRPDSIGFITGTVNAAFQTTAQHDAISSTVGTLSPACVIVVDEDVYFIDRKLRPHRLNGGALEELWRASPEDLGYSGAPLIETAPSAAYVSEVRAVMFERTAQGGPGHLPDVYDATTGTYFGSWGFPIASMRAMGTLRNGEGVPVTVIIGTSDNAGALGVEGYVYRFTARGEATTFDSDLWASGQGASASGKREIQVILGADVEADQRFHQIVAEVSNDPGGPWTWKLDTVGTYAEQTGLSAVSAGSTTAATNNGTAATFEADRVAWGINEASRHLQVKVRCEDLTHSRVRVGRVVAHRSRAGTSPDGR